MGLRSILWCGEGTYTSRYVRESCRSRQAEQGVKYQVVD